MNDESRTVESVARDMVIRSIAVPARVHPQPNCEIGIAAKTPEAKKAERDRERQLFEAVADPRKRTQ